MIDDRPDIWMEIRECDEADRRSTGRLAVFLGLAYLASILCTLFAGIRP